MDTPERIDRIVSYTHDEFMRAIFPSVPLIGDNILDASEKMAIVGASESGKSFLALQLAYELATGGSFFGFPVMQECHVEIYQSEVSIQRYQERYANLARSYDMRGREDHLRSVTIEDLKLDTLAGCDDFAYHIQRTRPNVVIVDPLRAFFAGDENESQAVEAFFQAIAAAQTTPPFTLIYVHHIRKEMPGFTGEFNKNSARGSGLIIDRPSTVLMFSVNAAQTEWTLTFAKTRNRNRHPDPIKLCVDWDTGLFVPSSEADPIAMYTAWVVESLRGRSRMQSDVVAELSIMRGVEARTVSNWIVRAAAAGLIKRERVSGAGNPWRLSPATPTSPASVRNLTNGKNDGKLEVD